MVDRRIGFGRIPRAAGALALVLLAHPAFGQEEAKELVRSAVMASSAKPSVARVTLSSGGESRELETKRLREGMDERVRIDVTAPFLYKGVRYFFHEVEGRNDHHSYLPALKRTVRVAEDALETPFLATEFYVIDMIPPNLDAHRYQFVGEEEVGGRKCRLVESVPERLTLYAKTVMAIDPVDKVILRIDFFDSVGKPLKRWSVDRLEQVDGIWTPLEQRMTGLQDQAEWRLKIEEIKYDEPLTADDFSPVGLGR